MDDELNPYAPPTAESEPLPAARTGSDALPYYPVSNLKLVVLSVFTLQLYNFYWMYKQWQAIRDHHGTPLRPFWRAFFGVWFAYSLFDHVRLHSRWANLPGNVPAGASAAAFILFTILGRIGGRTGNDVLWALGFLTVVPLVVMQGPINRFVRHHDRDADMNERFTAVNVIAILFGAAFWALILYGMAAE